MAGGLGTTINTTEWHRLKGTLDTFGPSLSRGLRSHLRLIGTDAVSKVRETLSQAPPTGGVSGTDYREALIKGTRFSVSFGARAAGAKIVTSGSALPEQHAGLLKVYNMAKFRHPVFQTGQWVEQQGRPYFGAVIVEYANLNMLIEIRGALNDTLKAIGAKNV